MEGGAEGAPLSTELSPPDARPPQAAAGGGRQLLVRLDELAAGLASRRGVLALWVVGTAGAALVALLMHWAALPGWDDAAHVYKLYLLRTGQGVFWDNAWYGGGYGAITYGVLFYWLAQFIPAKVIVVVAAGAVPVLYYLYQRDMWKIADPLPAWLFAVVMAVYLAHGQDPFVLALALTLAGLALLARDHPVLAALPVAVGIFANPLAFVTCGVFMLADVLARPRVRRRYFVFFAAVAPFVAARLLLGWAFGEPSRYLNETSELLLYLGFALAGAALAGLNAAHRRRPLVILFLTYAFLCVASFVMPGSAIGNNIGRFFFVFCLPLLFLLRHSRLRRPFPSGDMVMIVVLVFAVLQFSAPYSHFTTAPERPQSRAPFFAPALTAARQLYDPNYRFHVVALRRHWEAYYFPHAGYAITRGWYRQADAIHNGLFYSVYDGRAYVAWLRSMGVKYIFEPHTVVDAWSRGEVRILHSSPDFVPVEQAGAWTIYRLRDARPLVTALAGHGRGNVTHMDHLSMAFTLSAPGRYLVKLTYTPYWELLGGPGVVRRGPGDFTVVDAARAGAYRLQFRVTAAEALHQIGQHLHL
jgi:hypothetical protein